MSRLAIRWFDQRLAKIEHGLERDWLLRSLADARNIFHRSPGLD